MKCKCGSYAINPHLYGRDDTDLDLCDLCYWRKRANSLQQLNAKIAATLEKGVYTHNRDNVVIVMDKPDYERLRQLSAV